MVVTVALMVWAHGVLDREMLLAFVIGGALVATGLKVWLSSTKRL